MGCCRLAHRGRDWRTSTRRTLLGEGSGNPAGELERCTAAISRTIAHDRRPGERRSDGGVGREHPCSALRRVALTAPTPAPSPMATRGAVLRKGPTSGHHLGRRTVGASRLGPVHRARPEPLRLVPLGIGWNDLGVMQMSDSRSRNVAPHPRKATKKGALTVDAFMSRRKTTFTSSSTTARSWSRRSGFSRAITQIAGWSTSPAWRK